MIRKFITNLSDLQKKIFGTVLIVLICVLFYTLLLMPTMNRIKHLDTSIQGEKVAIQKDLKFLTEKDRIDEETDLLNQFVSYEDQLPVEEELIAAFLKKLEVLSIKAGVTVAKVVPSAGEKKDNIIRYTADLDVTGTLKDIVNFMHIVDNADALMKVVKYTMVAKKGDVADSVKSLMTIEYLVIDNQAKPKTATPLEPDHEETGNSTPATN